MPHPRGPRTWKERVDEGLYQALASLHGLKWIVERVGTVLVVLSFAFITWRAFQIGTLAERLDQRFPAFVAYGLGLGFGLQAFINVGVNVGLLPTKGLTLPLMSYGGNSIILACLVIALLLRIDFDNRRLAAGATGRGGGAWDR